MSERTALERQLESIVETKQGEVNDALVRAEKAEARVRELEAELFHLDAKVKETREAETRASEVAKHLTERSSRLEDQLTDALGVVGAGNAFDDNLVKGATGGHAHGCDYVERWQRPLGDRPDESTCDCGLVAFRRSIAIYEEKWGGKGTGPRPDQSES